MYPSLRSYHQRQPRINNLLHYIGALFFSSILPPRPDKYETSVHHDAAAALPLPLPVIIRCRPYPLNGSWNYTGGDFSEQMQLAVGNDKIWSNTNTPARAIVEKATLYLREWKEVNDSDEGLTNQSQTFIDRWIKPTRGMMKLNVDASVDVVRQKMGFGWILINESGRFVGAKAMPGRDERDDGDVLEQRHKATSNGVLPHGEFTGDSGCDRNSRPQQQNASEDKEFVCIWDSNFVVNPYQVLRLWFIMWLESYFDRVVKGEGTALD
nr:Putative ribonuclease H protein At1g65750 family [Ipomoea batatas]